MEVSGMFYICRYCVFTYCGRIYKSKDESEINKDFLNKDDDNNKTANEAGIILYFGSITQYCHISFWS